MKKTIITGGTGFIGSRLCKYLIKNGWEVSIVARPTSKYSYLKEVKNDVEIYIYSGDINDLVSFFKRKNADVVFHLASLYLTEHDIRDVDEIVDCNVKFGVQILEAMKKSRTKLIINTGTSWQHYNGEPYNPVNLYAASKQAFESMLKYYTEAEDIRAITLKLFDTYGESDNRPKLLNLLGNLSSKNKKIELSKGNQLIDLVHVDDVVEAYNSAYNYLEKNKIIKMKDFAVSSGKTIKLYDLVSLFQEIIGENFPVLWGVKPYRKREVMEPWSTFEILPNWECKITLEEGLKKLYSVSKEL